MKDGDHLRKKTTTDWIPTTRSTMTDRSWRHHATEKKTLKMKPRTDLLGREKRTITLKTGFVYHVRNSPCIHLRTEDPNIYMYMKEKIYNEPPEEIQ
jgi:hypothetical protein